MMDLKTIRDELRKLTMIAGDWETPSDITALERELMLEKLRKLYDVLRFDVVDATQSDKQSSTYGIETDEVGVDLGELLSLGLLDEEDAVVLSREASSPASQSEAILASSFVVTPQVPFVGAAVSTPELEEESVAAVAPLDEALFEEPAAEEPVAEEPVAEESVAEEPVAEEPATEESVAEEPAAEEPAAEEPQPEVAVPFLASLFGDDEELIVRHRHKQRVIMSLYDTNPTESHSESKPSDSTPEVFVLDSVVAPLEEKPSESTSEIDPNFEASEPVETSLSPSIEPQQDFEDVGDFDAEIEEVTLAPGTILGDVINHDRQTLADRIAPQRSASSDILHNEPLVDLRKAIGINDKFLLIRDLFGGDGEEFDAAIGELNDAESLDDCMIYIAENYSWNPNSDGAKLIMELIERKFS